MCGSWGLRRTFQHTAARRRLKSAQAMTSRWRAFQHTAARRRLIINGQQPRSKGHVSTHSRPKAADGMKSWAVATVLVVSTHSRPKAAEASSKNLMSSSLICLISLKSLKKMKNSITQPYESLHHSSNLLIIKEQS